MSEMILEEQNTSTPAKLDNKQDENAIAVPDNIAEILNKSDLNEDEKHAIMECVTSVESFSGPLPPPAIFEEYEKALPGAADRIMSMAENEASHRHEMEKKIADSDSRDSLLGIIAAWSICIVCIVGGGLLACKAPNVAGNICGVLLAGGGLVGVIGAFLKGTKANWK